MKNLVRSLWFLACSGIPLAAQAVTFEITPFAGYRFGGRFEQEATRQDVDLRESSIFGVAVDTEYAPGQQIEVFYSRQRTALEQISPRVHMDVEYFQIGGVAAYPQDEFTPYVVGTVGAIRLSPSRNGLDAESRFAVTVGGGVKYFLNQNVALKFETRGYFTLFNSDTDLFCVSNLGNGSCLLRTSGSVMWQIEATAGVTFRF